MSDFLNLNWIFGKGTRRRKNTMQPLTIHSESGFEHYKTREPNSNVELRRKPRSATASEHRPNKRRMSWVSRNENFNKKIKNIRNNKVTEIIP